MERPHLQISAIVIEAPDAPGLAAFYRRLLEWTVIEDSPGWVRLRHPSDEVHVGLSFSQDDNFIAPVWPGAPDQQQMMLHLDIAVEDLAASEAWALEAGATLADHQPQSHVRVMLDPCGHPFCLFRETP